MSLSTAIILIIQVVTIVAVAYVVMNGRQPSKTMAWAMVVYFVPVVGIVAYLFFGLNRRKERLISRRSLDQLTRRSLLGYAEQQFDQHIPEERQTMVDMFVNESLALPLTGSGVSFLRDGYEFFPALLRDIAEAREHIHIEMYIFLDDALGTLLADALLDKARQGIEVRVAYDHVGCWTATGAFFERMREGGIEVAPFIPVRFPMLTRRANYRNHRKVVVIDGRMGYIGGMNIALRYVKGMTPKAERPAMPWRDTMVRVEGPVVSALQRVFLTDWFFVDRTLLSDRNYYPPSVAALPSPSLMQVVTSSPTDEFPAIMQGYLRVIYSAHKYIYIETPYFLPTDAVLLALKTAAASGVEVRLLVPARGDAWFVEWASRSYLREAVEAGIRVELFVGGFLHSKLLVADDTVCSCGSTNMDFRSFENNFEANLFIYGNEEALRAKELFRHDAESATPFEEYPSLANPRFLPRLGEALARLFSPLL